MWLPAAQPAASTAIQSGKDLPALVLPYAVPCSYIRSFVDACDAIGTGCCFSIVVIDPSEPFEPFGHWGSSPALPTARHGVAIPCP